jgi:Eukaryotic DNA topoisomerase I, catalytic core
VTSRDASKTAITRASAREKAPNTYVIAFADELPVIREKVREHMSLRGLPREKVLATVVHLLETTLIRVGNDDYAKQNNSYGLTTLKNRHVAVDGSEVRFRFTGKSGKQWSLRVRDRRVAKIIRACQDLPGGNSSNTLTGGCLPGCHLGGRKRLFPRKYRRGYHGKGLPHLGGNCSDGNDSLGAGEL